MKPGDKLKNGATYIGHLTKDRILAYTGGTSIHPWVTWHLDEDGNCYHGSYHQDFPEVVLAMADELQP